MAELAVQAVHVETFARIARKIIERSIGNREADGAAFWLAVSKAYQRGPGPSRELVKL